jgi:hypothetical protein
MAGVEPTAEQHAAATARAEVIKVVDGLLRMAHDLGDMLPVFDQQVRTCPWCGKEETEIVEVDHTEIYYRMASDGFLFRHDEADSAPLVEFVVGCCSMPVKIEEPEYG